MNNIRNILVPTDFSEVANNALNYAFKMAKKLDSKIILYHVYHVPSVTHLPDNIEDRQKEVEKELAQKMDKLLESTASNDIETEKVTVLGLAGDEIKEVIKKRAIDLVIMGTHGASGIRGKLIGSITADIMVNSTVPVLAIPSSAEFTSLSNIAFAYDYGKINDHRELDTLVKLAEAFDATMHIIKVAEKGETEDKQAEDIVELEEHLQPVKHTYEVTTNDDVAKGIEEYINDNNIDLLAMMPRKHNIFERLFKGSTTRAVVENAKVPVFGFHGN